ncbi:MAG: hypothetical protein ACYS8Z_24445 [Planctomycetota bacterium]|jgi:uncharacterized lipoprotein YehR (DUF1307 family)
MSTKTLIIISALAASVCSFAGCKEAGNKVREPNKTSRKSTEAQEQINEADMELDICGDKIIKNPSDEDIRNAFAKLDTKTSAAFIILSRTTMTYIQAAGDRNVGFDLEYQEAAIEEHFKAKDKIMTIDDVVDAFIAYRNGDKNWRNKFDFERITW